jgi:hypothetical protein
MAGGEGSQAVTHGVRHYSMTEPEITYENGYLTLSDVSGIIAEQEEPDSSPVAVASVVVAKDCNVPGWGDCNNQWCIDNKVCIGEGTIAEDE